MNSVNGPIFLSIAQRKVGDIAEGVTECGGIPVFQV